MKKAIKWFGIIALVAVIGFSMAACKDDEEDGGSGGIIPGTFTITDIPATYNGKYAFFYAADATQTVLLVGIQSWDEKTETITHSRITNGRVSMPVWKVSVSNDNEDITKYSGNDTCSVMWAIFNYETANGDISDENDDDALFTDIFESVKFSNGGAVKSYKDGSLWMYQSIDFQE